MAGADVFPELRARDLQGLDVQLPDAFVGERNLVAIAFRREHQSLVDGWASWFDAHSAPAAQLRFYEVPTIGRLWSPMRRFIDGGMAAAIKDPVILQRTFTIYGDVGLVTRPLDIADRSTITVLLVDAEGRVLWRTTGGCTDSAARGLQAALAGDHGDSSDR